MRLKENKNYLMMFEFEKIELIDGRWKEEIDQIEFELGSTWEQFTVQAANVARGDGSETMEFDVRVIASSAISWH